MKKIQGPHGHADQWDIEAIRCKAGRMDATVSAWLIYAPRAHPLWHSYALFLIHLRPLTGHQPPKIYLPGATHEIMLFALDPKARIELDEVPAHSLLQPINFAAQFMATADADAAAKIEFHITEIVNGHLSPDTDYTQAWIARFNASMIKGDPKRAGETKIIIEKADGSRTEIVHDPKDPDAKPL